MKFVRDTRFVIRRNIQKNGYLCHLKIKQWAFIRKIKSIYLFRYKRETKIFQL